jgi:hypothetical protein
VALVAPVLGSCGARIDPLVHAPLRARDIPPIGASSRHHPGSLGAAVRAGRPIGRLRCGTTDGPHYGIHLELFGAGQTIIVPAGIGIAPPRRVDGVYVRGGRCSYRLRTREPTGVVEVRRGRVPTLGDFFTVWGQPLSAWRMAGWRGTVKAYVDGRRRHGDVRAIPLGRHVQVVLVVGPDVPVHRRYPFPPGL